MKSLAALRRMVPARTVGFCAAVTFGAGLVPLAAAEPLSGPLPQARQDATGDRNANAFRAPRNPGQTNPCSAYGPGFVPAAGGTTCVKLGGQVIMEFSTGRGQNAFGPR